MRLAGDMVNTGWGAHVVGGVLAAGPPCRGRMVTLAVRRGLSTLSALTPNRVANRPEDQPAS
jgi:hypothetical protein